jgi:hypothetical protein
MVRRIEADLVAGEEHCRIDPAKAMECERHFLNALQRAINVLATGTQFELISTRLLALPARRRS